MGSTTDFWRSEERWPRDDPQYIFLGRAVHLLGKAIFGEGWSGAEPASQAPPRFGVSSNHQAVHNFIADNLRQFGRVAYHGSMAPPPIGYSGPDYRPRLPQIRTDEWKAVTELLSQHAAAHSTATERLKRVQEAIADYAVAGELKLVYRPPMGGTFHEMPREWWRTEGLAQRFAFCSIDPQSPFKQGGKAWIFVEADSLKSVIKSIAPAQRALINAETECQQWLEQQFLVDQEKATPKEVYKKRALAHFAGLSGKSFSRAWDAAVKTDPERRNAGRKPGNRFG